MEETKTMKIYAVVKDFSKDEKAYQELMDDSEFHCDEYPTPYIRYIKYYDDKQEAQNLVDKFAKLWQRAKDEEDDSFLICREDWGPIINPAAYSVETIEVILKDKK